MLQGRQSDEQPLLGINSPVYSVSRALSLCMCVCVCVSLSVSLSLCLCLSLAPSQLLSCINSPVSLLFGVRS